MHARVVSMEILPINMEEAVRIYRDSVVPAAKEERGFRGALTLVDPYTGEAVSASLRESEEDMRASETSGFYHRKLDQLDGFLSARLYVSTTRSAFRRSGGTGLVRVRGIRWVKAQSPSHT